MKRIAHFEVNENQELRSTRASLEEVARQMGTTVAIVHRLDLLATAIVGGRLGELSEPIMVRAGEGFVAVPEEERT